MWSKTTLDHTDVHYKDKKVNFWVTDPFNFLEKENNMCMLAVVSVNFRKGGGISNHMELT